MQRCLLPDESKAMPRLKKPDPKAEPRDEIPVKKLWKKTKVMGLELIRYLNKRTNRTEDKTGKTGPPGPVITISREVGCSGLELAEILAGRLNKPEPAVEWKVLSKEIFQKSAHELELDPLKVAKIFRQNERTAFDEFLNAFGEKRYKSDKKIKKTVCEVIRNYAEEGFCIIVGRGGNAIAADIRNAIHIRLVAPLEYRVASIMEKNGLDRDGAFDFIRKVEKERLAYRHAVEGKSAGEPEIFDITFNRAVFPADVIVDLILLAIQEKKILDEYQAKK
jgi:cytidylate kinase